MRLPALLLLSLAACAQAESPPASPSRAPAPPAATSPGSSAEANPGRGGEPRSVPLRLEGTFSSPKCGERPYERRITFEEGGAFKAEDRVSPCPPGAQCIWSGIVDRSGRYEVRGGGIELTVTGGDSNAAAKPLPSSLGFDAEKGVPFEASPEGRCLYQKAP